MLSFMLNIEVKKETIADSVIALSSIDKIANQDKGCISFTWFQKTDEPEKFVLIENWDSQENLDNHIKRITGTWNKFIPYLQGEAVSTKLTKLVQ